MRFDDTKRPEVSALPRPDVHQLRPATLESPALIRGETRIPAFEVKFLLSEEEAREVERRLRPRMAPDVHADPALGGAYRVTSVYFDTPRLDVYHRSERYRRRKFRVRRYGSNPTVYLERKSKREQRVRKRRTATSLDDLPKLWSTSPPDGPGVWFVRQIAARALKPVCRVSYLRMALVGTNHGSPIRITFDRDAHGGLANGQVPEYVSNGNPLLNNEVIVEFKFLASMPAVFKDVIEGLRLGPRPVSKYRRCIDAVGLAAEGRNG